MRILSFIVTLSCLSLLACHKDLSPAEQLKKDIGIIENYLAEKGLVAQSTPSGLHYIITAAGSGSHPAASATVTVQYTGYLTDGTVFDKTDAGKTATFPLANLITGWQEGIPLVGKGGKITLILPSALAYGPSGSGSVPANAVLVFDITLVDF